MGHPILDHSLLAIAWAAAGLALMALAGEGGRRRADRLLGPWARLSRNMAGLALVAAVLAVEQYAFPERRMLDWSEDGRRVLWGIQGLGGLLILYAITRHDIGRLTGLAQVRPDIEARFGPKRGHSRGTVPARPAEQGAGTREAETPADAPEPLRTGGLHRYVRYPLCTGLFLLLWGRLFDEFQIASALWASLCVIAAAHLEDRRLLRVHGAAFARYRSAVPAFLPWRGRAWKE